eukprot:13499748-Ditylum_brightwellii.AAC.2
MLLRYQQLNMRMYSNTVDVDVKSLKGNISAHVFGTENFIQIHLMTTKSDASRVLQVLAKDIGVPNKLFFDNVQEKIVKNSKFMKTIRFLRMKWRAPELHSS